VEQAARLGGVDARAAVAPAAPASKDHTSCACTIDRSNLGQARREVSRADGYDGIASLYAGFITTAFYLEGSFCHPKVLES